MRKKYFNSIFTVLFLALVVALSCVSLSFAAPSNTDISNAKKLTLGEKAGFTFDAQDPDNTLFYKVKITKKGIYKLTVYNDLGDPMASEKAWAGLYSSASAAKKVSGRGRIDEERNYSDGDNLCRYFRLKKGTYYLAVQHNIEDKLKSGVKIENAGNPYLYDYFGDIYEYQTMEAGVRDLDGNEVKKVSSVRSSNTSVIEASKNKYGMVKLHGKNTGRAKITIKYTGRNGKKGVYTRTFDVKKYPAAVKSLKVNGKSVSIKKHRFEYNTKTTKKTTAVKVAPKKGWKVDYVNIEIMGPNGKYKRIEGSKAKKHVINGTSVDFSKSYNYMAYNIKLRKENGAEKDSMEYRVGIERS